MFLAPVLLEVERQVQRQLAGDPIDKIGLRVSFANARGYLRDSDALFREVQETLLTDDMGEQKLTLAGQEMSYTKLCLDRLEETCLADRRLILGDRLQAFLTSARGCLQLFGEFAATARQQPIYSPSPPFDAFVKSGIKVLEGRLEAFTLEPRIPAIGSEIARFARLLGCLERIYDLPAPALGSARGDLKRLEAGLGAILQWQRDRDGAVLKDGLSLLGSASSAIVGQLQSLDLITAGQRRYTSFRALEGWLRLRCLVSTSPDEIPRAWLSACVADVFRTWDYLLARSRELAANPLASSAEARSLQERQQSVRARAEAEVMATSSQDPMALPESFWVGLVPDLEHLQGEVEARQRALEESVAPFQELPGLELLASLKERVRSGEVEGRLFRAELERQLERVEALIGSVALARDPISAEFHALLPIHRAAFLGMLACLESGNWNGLDGLWQGVVTTFPHLTSLSKGIAGRMARQSSAAQRITCLHCSAQNGPERRICSSCGANLPAVVQRAQSVAEIGVGEGGPTSTPPPRSSKALDLLEALVQGVESNTITRKGTGLAIEALLEDMDKVRKTFGNKVIPLMGQDATLDMYLRFFAGAMGAYGGALKQMQGFADGASLAQLHTSMAECRQVLLLLEELKARIDEALRG